MLKLYHNPISVNSRRVWIALLEKEIPFDLVSLNLDGDQFQPEFLALNPFHHIPVLVDDGFSIIESLAVLDYLEAKYPTPALLPNDAKALATVRMVEMIAVNELSTAMNPLLRQVMGFAGNDPQKLEQALQQSATVLTFFERLLAGHPYFGGEQLTLADIVAGTVVTWFPSLGVPLDDYPKLNAWSERLTERAAWQTTQPNLEAIEMFKSTMEALMAAQQSR